MNKIWSIDDIKQANRVNGKHWFSPDTLRFFNSRIGSKVYQGRGGIYFVSSERFGSNSERKFTVRKFDPETFDVSTAGEFNKLTMTTANRWAKEYSEGKRK